MKRGIDMRLRQIGTVQVLDKSDRGFSRGASWLCMCLSCREQFFDRGTNLRKAERKGWWTDGCPRCRPKDAPR